MIIRCETNNGYGVFYLPDIDTMEKLKEYADKQIPIECYMLRSNTRKSIYFKEDMKFVHLYLNNYLQYFQINAYIFDDDERIKLNKTVCFNCYNNEAYYGCIYKQDGCGCKNHKEIPESKLEKFIRKYLGRIVK